MLSPRLARPLTFLAVAAGLVACLALSFHRLDWPGLQYDEMLFANAALGRIDNTFIEYRFHSLTLFLMNYIGALKAWLYVPVFRLFGVSAATVRVPMVVVNAAALGLFFRACSRWAGRQAALYAFFLLASNAAFLWSARCDHGPVVLGTLLEVVAFAAFFEGAAWIFALACVLGLYQKLVFLFWLAGFLVAAALLYPERRRTLAVGAAASGAYIAAWRFLLGGPSREITSYGDHGERSRAFGAQLSDLLDGGSFYRYLQLDDPWSLPVWALVLAVVAYSLYRSRGAGSRPLRLLAFQFALSLAVTYGVSSALYYWHFLGLLPWIYLAAGIALAQRARAGAVLFGLLLAANVYGLARSSGEIGARPGYARFTMAIYPLIGYCRALPDRLCASISWGTHTQLEAFTWPGRYPYSPDAERRDPDPRFVYVDYDGLVSVPHTDSQAFFRRAEEAGWKPSLLKRIDDGDRSMFLVYEFRKLTSSAEPGSPR